MKTPLSREILQQNDPRSYNCLKVKMLICGDRSKMEKTEMPTKQNQNLGDYQFFVRLALLDPKNGVKQ